MLFGGLMLIPAAALLFTARPGNSAGWARAVSYVALVALALIGLGAVLFSGGFTVPFVF